MWFSNRASTTCFMLWRNPTRVALVERLAAGEASAGELARPLAMTLTGVQKHLRVLERAGVIRTFKSGRERRCLLVENSLAPAEQWLSSRRVLWSGRLRALDDYLKSEGDDHV